jgi:hypothetical protein
MRGEPCAPRVTQLVQHVGQRVRVRGLPRRDVAAGGPLRGPTGGSGAEVGPVAAERGHPLLARVIDVVGDEVCGVGFVAAGHRHVGRGRGGGVGQHEVRFGVVSPWAP